MNERALGFHFEFGANWLDYLQHVDEAAIREAEKGLLKLIPQDELRGARFLDIGCGSGLHALAAVRLGSGGVVAIDIDPDSVLAARTTLAGRDNASVRELSIFDASPDELGLFDVVYSWGVLHHTGAMWDAVARAAALVRPGGLLALALYQKTPCCGMWRAEKRFYTAAPEPIRAIVRAFYKSICFFRLLLSGRNPFRVIREYKSSRGMNFHIDVRDWLGGYPYESASPAEIHRQLAALNFEAFREYPLPRAIGLLGTGCAEFVFRRTRRNESGQDLGE